MKEYILSLDQGTTSSRAVLFNAKGEKVASVQKEYPQIFPGNGWVEHDPMDILESQLSSAREVIAKAGITAEDVAAIGIANQRERRYFGTRTPASLFITLSFGNAGGLLRTAHEWKVRACKSFSRTRRDFLSTLISLPQR